MKNYDTTLTLQSCSKEESIIALEKMLEKVKGTNYMGSINETVEISHCGFNEIITK